MIKQIFKAIKERIFGPSDATINEYIERLEEAIIEFNPIELNFILNSPYGNYIPYEKYFGRLCNFVDSSTDSKTAMLIDIFLKYGDLHRAAVIKGFASVTNRDAFDCINVFIEHGLSPNEGSNDIIYGRCDPPFIYAVCNGSIDTVKLMLDNGANPDCHEILNRNCNSNVLELVVNTITSLEKISRLCEPSSNTDHTGVNAHSYCEKKVGQYKKCLELLLDKKAKLDQQ